METTIKKITSTNQYNPREEQFILKAYEYAKSLHNGQVRQSGEPYISHPLNVAYILLEMQANRDTICQPYSMIL